MLRVMVVGFSISTFGASILGRFMSVYAVNFIGISNTEWGLVQSTSGVINVIARVPFGRLTDLYGRRKPIIISYLVRPLFLLLFVHSRNLPHVLVTQSLSTLARDMESPAWQALVADVTPRKKRGRAYVSFRMISSAFSIVAPTIGAFLWKTYGPVWAFYVTILVEIPAVVFFYLFLKDPTSREK